MVIDATDQVYIDKMMIELDGTANKSRLGANAILGCSMGQLPTLRQTQRENPFSDTLEDQMQKPFLIPMIQIIGGGAHAANAIVFRISL